MEFYNTHVVNHLVRENRFRHIPLKDDDLPIYKQIQHLLPEPIWENHESVIACYHRAWELAFGNLRQPSLDSGFVSNYIDTAFNGHLFMWDSCFILLFGVYGRRAFNFLSTLDNFYAKQHADGYICREIDEDTGQDCYGRFDPSSTGPNLMPWTEWEYFCNTTDIDRLGDVFPVLLAYYQWFRKWRTWQDGTYWATGYACGMDNQPRMPNGNHPCFDHGHMVWLDTCCQQVFVANILIKMARALGRSGEIRHLREEMRILGSFINRKLWNELHGFYYDRWADGRFSTAKTIGAYWALLAGIVPEEKLGRFVDHLCNEQEFARPHRIPTLSADHPEYQARGGYWLGGVWAPTNYMVMRGLDAVGLKSLASEIAENHLSNVIRVFEKTGTLWENYAPESADYGVSLNDKHPAKSDFVGWTGLVPITELFEYIFGIRTNAIAAEISWDVRLLEEHGVSRLPFSRKGMVDLLCHSRKASSEKPILEIKSTLPIKLILRWQGGEEEFRISGEGKKQTLTL